jgi:AmmeMemoRadiSam system protein A
VTLRRQGRLRGCIGRIDAAEHSLADDVRHNARRAAFDDPRFEPLATHEWDGLRVEVSLLTPPEPLPVASERDALRLLRPGVDGVIFGYRHRRATLLPQVWDDLPDARDFLAALKYKAGFAADFWHREVALARYRAYKFTDDAGP